MTPLPVDLRLLESFIVLAEELHFTRAAERLHLAQPRSASRSRGSSAISPRRSSPASPWR